MHFSPASVDHFSENFLGSIEGGHTEDLEDDGLGYYEDGTKRTLTDEQIAMFRHSEIQTLLRDHRHAQEAKQSASNGQEMTVSAGEEIDVEDGELEDDNVVAEAPAPFPPPKSKPPLSKKAKKAQYAKEKGFFKQKIKPDLRKRTWDKVDTGLDGLDYDEANTSSARAPSMASQRRKISYDDD